MPRHTILALVLLLLSATAASQAPSGYRTFDDKATGVRFYYPRNFKAIPVQPTEELIIARFERSRPRPSSQKDDRREPSQIFVFVLEDRTTPAAGEETAAAAPRTVEEMVASRNRIHFYKDFMASRFSKWEISQIGEESDHRELEFELAVKTDRSRSGYLYTRHVPGHTYGVVGFCDDVVSDSMRSRFRRVGESMHAPKGAHTGVKDVSESIYRGKDYRDIPFRLEARRAMVKGWKPYDTENFFLVYHTDNKKLVSKIANDLEAVRPLYMQYFPPVQPIEAVSVVRICKDRDEYFLYGGPQGSAGYWNYVAKELVLYDFTGGDAGKSGRRGRLSDSYIVLYHEAFHQYIFYAAGELRPHMWFNEGIGDFFSGTVVYSGSSRIKGVDLNRWRLPLVKKIVDTDAFIPLDKLVNADRAAYYHPQRRSLMYAEGWAISYFLLQGEKDHLHPEWAKIIPTYFEELKAGYAKHVGTLTESATLADRNKAEEAARQDAIAKALTGIDVAELDGVWREWIRRIED